MEEQKVMDINEAEQILTMLSGGPAKVGSLEGRMAVAAAFGYMDARTMVFFKETHGMALSIVAMMAVKKGLKIDYSGLRYELEKIGKNPDTIDSELKEVRFFAEPAGSSNSPHTRI